MDLPDARVGVTERDGLEPTVADLSLGEYRALVAKAFRGAGYHWGLTEEAAHAASELAAFGARPTDGIIRLLDRVRTMSQDHVMPNHEWRSASGVLCPICVGTSIADSGRADDLDLGPTLEPILIAPFVRSILRPDEPGRRIAWRGGQVDVQVDSIVVTGPEPTDPVPVTVRSLGGGTSSGTTTRSAGRVELDRGALAALERLAHRVYAPATDESRRSGAGGDL